MPEIDGGSVLNARARSASDAAVLRRKGHLKEQDRLIEFLLTMHDTHTSLEAMQKMERWIIEHRQVCPRPCPRLVELQPCPRSLSSPGMAGCCPPYGKG